MADLVAQAGQFKVELFDWLAYGDYLACKNENGYLHLKRIDPEQDLIHQAQELLEEAHTYVAMQTPSN
jgi:hypothetical protein